MLPRENQRGVAIHFNDGKIFLYYHSWFQDQLDENDRVGHAKELIREFAPQYTGKSFSVVPVIYKNGKHKATAQYLCGYCAK